MPSLRSVLAGLVLALWALSCAPPAVAQPEDQVRSDEDALARGEYLFNAGGCANCHTDRKNDGPLLGGGAPINSPFGTFYGPNISPHPEHGIGTWTDADFIRALREGVSPGGAHYYPAFPYTSFTLMTERDMRDLKAYIFTLPPVAAPSREHDLALPVRFRPALALWKMLYFEDGAFTPDPARSEEWNRGAYLSNALLHCGECHTPRTMLGGLERDRWLSGAENPEGEGMVPNITPSPKGIGDWSVEDIMASLEMGMTPEGDFFGSLMAEVVEHGTSKLTEADRRAIAVYLKSLPPVPAAGAGE